MRNDTVFNRITRIAAAGVIGGLLAACGGGSAPAPVPSVPSGSTGTLAITIKMPGSSVAVRGVRHRLFTSRATKGVGFEYKSTFGGGYSGAPSTSPNYGSSIIAGSKGCAPANSDGSFSCTLLVGGMPVGYDDLRIALWDTAPAGASCVANGSSCSFAGAKALSSQVITNQIILSGLNNTLTFTTLPIVDSVSVVSNASIVDGTAFTPAGQNVFVALKDAAGNYITGSDGLIDANANPLTVTLDIANDLGTSGCNRYNVTPCSLYFSGAALPSMTNASVTQFAMNYDGFQQFPSNGDAAVSTTTSAGPTATGSYVSIPLTSVTGVTVGNLYAIDSGANQEFVRVASISGSNAVVYQAAIAHAAGVAFVNVPVPQLTLGVTGGTINGSNLPFNMTVTRSTGGIAVPAAPQFGAKSDALTASPSTLASAPNGDLYLHESGGQVAFFTPCAIAPCAHTNVTLAPGALAGSVAIGADGYLWYTDTANHKIVKQPLGAAGTPVSSAVVNGLSTGRITAGPDGNLWFAETGTTKLARIAPNTMAITEPYDLGSFANGVIAAGTFNNGDQAVCVDAHNGVNDYLDCYDITLGAAIASNPIIGTNVQAAGAMAFGRDGLLYVSIGTNDIRSYSLSAGSIALNADYPMLNGSAHVQGLATGPDGNLWFTESGNANVLGRITIVQASGPVPYKTGLKQEWGAAVQLPANTTPGLLILGSDNKLWFSDIGGINNTVDQVKP